MGTGKNATPKGSRRNPERFAERAILDGLASGAVSGRERAVAIKALVQLRGISLRELSLRAGANADAVSTTLRVPWPRLEKAISDFLGVDPWMLWPDRYDSNHVHHTRGGEKWSQERRAAHRSVA